MPPLSHSLIKLLQTLDMMRRSGFLAGCVCSPAQMITWTGPSKVTFFVTQLQSVPLSQAVNLCSHKPGSLYPCLCKARHRSDVIKHLLKVSHSPVDPPLPCRQRSRSAVEFPPILKLCVCVRVRVSDSEQGAICLLAAASPGGWDVHPGKRGAAVWVGPATGDKPPASG